MTNNNQIQGNLVSADLSSMLDTNNELYKLGKKINWNSIQEKIASNFSSDTGRPSIPLRCHIVLQILKFLRNLSDIGVLREFVENVYVQYFCGYTEFQQDPPCTSASLSIFRKKIGSQGAAIIFEESVKINEINIQLTHTIADTTVVCKNITYPTDVKLLLKSAVSLQNIAKQFSIKLNNTYRHQIDQLKKRLRFENTLKKTKEWRAAKKKLRTLVGRLYREIRRKMDKEDYVFIQETMEQIQKILNQTTSDSYYCQKQQTTTNILQAIQYYCLLKKYLRELNITIDAKIENEFKEAIKTLKSKNLSLKESKKLFDTLIKIIKKVLKSVPTDLDTEIGTKISVINDYVTNINKDKKIYSLHEPQVRCISKGKPGKKHEYGAKASIIIDEETCLIIGAQIFSDNPHDSKTLEPTLKGIEEQFNCRPAQVAVDRGYRGCQANGVKIVIPHNVKTEETDSDKSALSKTCRRRSAIEPVIGHLKADHRLNPVRLKGTLGDSINLTLSAAAFNFQKWCNSKVSNC